jgi:MYXO-CTERM domain-containing protein
MMRRLGVTAALAAALMLLVGARAEAYVRYKTSKGFDFFWAQTCVPLFAYPLSMKDVNGNMQMTTDEIMHAATAAAGAWNGAHVNDGDPACTYLKINVTEHDEATPAAGLDYTNALVFRTDSWCPPSDPTMCYAPEALAITSVFVNKSTGRIMDGDIEVNVLNFIWTDLDIDPSGNRKQDLQNALTHEMGHLIGLDHTCYQPGQPGGIPLDNNGNPIPSCDSAPPDVQATTMFASAIPGDTQKRTLAPDDIQAICDIYPPAKDPMFCPAKDEPPPDPGCGSSVAGPGAAGGLFAALAALAALTLARRRRAAR